MNKKSNDFGYIQIRYDKDSREGKIIEHFKNTQANASRYIREIIFLLEGYESLKEQKISSREIRNHCLESIGFLSSRLKIYETYYLEEQKYSRVNSFEGLEDKSYRDPTVKEVKNRRASPLKQNNISAHSFLPK